MDKNTDISTLCQRYLHGQMSARERKDFEQLLTQNPEVRKEYEFYLLMYKGFQEMEARGLKPTENAAARRKKAWMNVVVITAAVLLALLAALYFQPWNKTEEKNKIVPFGASGADIPSKVAWSPGGEIVIGGYFENRIRIGESVLMSRGGKDIFWAIASPNLEWTTAWSAGGDHDWDRCYDLAVDSKRNIIATGTFANTASFGNRVLQARGKLSKESVDFYIAKFQRNGNLLWIEHAGGRQIPDKETGANEGIAVTVDPQDNIIATGMYIGAPIIGDLTLPGGGPNEETYLLKYSANGQMIWGKGITGSYMSTAYDLATDASGNIFLTGYFGHHNLGGTIRFDGEALESYGGRDIFVAKYFPNGELAWARQAGSPNTNGRDFGISIATDSQGNCLVTGFFEGRSQFGDLSVTSKGARDIFVAKYDPNGQILWVRQAGGPNMDSGNAIATDHEGNVYVTGKFTGVAEFDGAPLSSRGQQDAFIVKYDPEGRILWLEQIGGDLNLLDSDSGVGITVTGKNEIVVTGFFSGTIRFGDQEMTSAGKQDLFIIKFDRKGFPQEWKNIPIV